MYNATEQQVKEWKKKYGEIFRVTIPEADKACYLKTPSRKALGYASMAGKENPLKSNEILLNECWIAGDEDIKTDDGLFLSVSSKLSELIVIKEAELEKL